MKGIRLQDYLYEQLSLNEEDIKKIQANHFPNHIDLKGLIIYNPILKETTLRGIKNKVSFNLRFIYEDEKVHKFARLYYENSFGWKILFLNPENYFTYTNALFNLEFENKPATFAQYVKVKNSLPKLNRILHKVCFIKRDIRDFQTKGRGVLKNVEEVYQFIIIQDKEGIRLETNCSNLCFNTFEEFLKIYEKYRYDFNDKDRVYETNKDYYHFEKVPERILKSLKSEVVVKKL